MRHLSWGWSLGAWAAVCLLAVGAWRFQVMVDAAPAAQVTRGASQAWPPVIDDAPRPSGYYAYIRFDNDAGPFLDRDLPVVYLDRAKHQKACFSGRVEGHLSHIVITTDFGRVTTHDPETDMGWVVSGCSDALITGSQVLTTREYWQTRLKLLPDTPDNAAPRMAIAQHIRALRPWWWPSHAGD